jgi:aromatic ring-opening dioxygenase catalytic subunit (LigB family)
LKFIWAIKFALGEELGKEVAVHYSSRLDNFVSREDVEKFMDQAKEAKIGWGYLMRLSKLSDQAKHFKIVARHSDVMKLDYYSLARVAIQLMGDDVMILATGGLGHPQVLIKRKPESLPYRSSLRRRRLDTYSR